MVSAAVDGNDVRWTLARRRIRSCRRTPPGLRDFAVQQRTDEGAWVTVSSATTRDGRDPRRTGRAGTGTACGSAPAIGPAMSVRGRTSSASGCHDPVIRRHPFRAVNLISDPIHGYVELTKRLERAESAAAGLPDEDVAEEDLLDTDLAAADAPDQPAPERPMGLPDGRALAVHPRSRRHARSRSVGTIALPEPPADALVEAGEPAPSEGLAVETLRMAGLAPRRGPRTVRPLL